MSGDPIRELLGRPIDGVARVVVVHERNSRFRAWGLLEALLKAFAFIILIPLWIYLLFASASDSDDYGGDGGGSASSRPKSGAAKRYRKSSLAYYGHDLVVRLLDERGEVLGEARSSCHSPTQADRLMAAVLWAAGEARLVVTEQIDVAPGKPGPLELATLWYGGRPLMSAPELRGAEALEAELERGGFTFERTNDEVIARKRTPPPGLTDTLVSIVILAVVLVWLFFTLTPIGVILLSPLILIALFVERRTLGKFGFETLCGLLRLGESYELRVSANTVSYRSRHAWRRSSGSDSGANLLAVGYLPGLGPAPACDRVPPEVHVVGREETLVLPRGLSAGVGLLLRDWLTSTLLERQATELHDFRSRCGHCASLYDHAEHPRCPNCGSAHLGAT